MNEHEQPQQEPANPTAPAAHSEPPQQALVKPARPAARGSAAGNLQKAASVVRAVMPVVQKMLPLLDGNVAAVVANLLTPGSSASSARVDLQPIEHALAKLQVEQRELRGQLSDQASTIQRMHQQLSALRDSAERSEQQLEEMRNELASTRRRIRVFSWIAIGALVLSLLANILLALRLAHLLP